MASKLKLEFAGITDVGRVREKNEDAIAISEEFQFAVLADGMGGYNGGEIASEMAVTGIKEILEKGLRRHRFHFFWKRSDHIRRLLEDAIAEVNQRIYQKARSNPRYYGMGTTLAAAVFHGNRVTIAHIGDSRIYRFRNGELEQLTRDHTWVQDQIEVGWMSVEEALVSDYRNLLTRAVGVTNSVKGDIAEFDTLPRDVYLLCSDGLTDMVSAEGIQEELNTSCDNVCSISERLIMQANSTGGEDNISIICTQVIE